MGSHAHVPLKQRWLVPQVPCMHTPEHPSLAPHALPVQLGAQTPVPQVFAVAPPPQVSADTHPPQSTTTPHRAFS
jgi:hypothetical protein